MVFSPEQPAAYDEDVLFETAGVLPALRSIGDHIVAATHTPSASMTFLVSGGFGTGKSSALRYLAGYVRERLTDGIILADYVASAFQDQPDRVRATLIYQLVQALALYSDDLYPIRDLVRALQPRDETTDVIDPDARRVLDRLTLIRAIEESETSAPILEEWLRRYINDGDRHPVTVVFVDDLDRCNYEFTTAVLQATNLWAWLPNHFFVVACSESHLERSLAATYPTMAEKLDSGLRKYIHHTVRLPERILNRSHAASLVKAVVAQVVTDAELAKRLHTAIDASARASETKLDLASPLIDPHWAPTPRDVKRQINALLAEVREWVDEASLKREIVRAVWSSEWRDYLVPALSDRTKSAWCQSFTAFGRSVARHSWDLELLEVAVREEARRTGFDLFSADPLLAVYLASDPAPPRGMFGESLDDSEHMEALADIAGADERVESSPAEALPLADFLRVPFDSDTDDLIEAGAVLEPLLTEFEIARASENLERMSKAVQAIIERLTADPATLSDRGLAVRLGNAALRSDRFGLKREALALHMAALQGAPLHSNINQNFVDFVVDNSVSRLYDRADESLRRLETEPGMTEWKPFRTQLLRLKLDHARGQSIVDLSEVLDAVNEDVDSGQLSDMLRLAIESDQYSVAPDIAAELIHRDQEPRVIAATLTVLAGGMWSSSSVDDEDFSATVYRFLFESGLATFLPPEMVGDIVSNYSRIFAHRGLTQRAGYLNYQAFRLHREEEEIATRLARWLSENGQPDLADRALRKHDVVVPFSLPLDEALPDSAEARRWLAANLEPRYADPLLPEFFEQRQSS